MKKILITDTSVLINFLNINRLDLLADFPGKFLITQHVLDEITNDFHEQQQRLDVALVAGWLKVVSVDSECELRLFNQLMKERRLGAGECSAIACAVCGNFDLAMEDVRACKQALALHPTIEIFKTQDIMLKLIMEGAISVDEADLIKNDWQVNYRFHLKFKTFLELVPVELTVENL